ncbi:MAG: biliverdin-producing heme oxygenase, partial [Candidatus Microthrix parvicella]
QPVRSEKADARRYRAGCRPVGGGVRRSGRDPRAKQGLDVSLDGGVTEILFVLGLGLKTDLDWLELELDASDAQASATVLPATRTYLGDLSGGFFVGKRIREIYGLAPDGGASVFDFPEIVGPGAWKQRYRDNLDALEWSAEEQQAFVDEAKTAYLHHSKVFDELAELQPGSGLFHWWWRSEGCFGVTGSASGGGGVLGAGLGCCRPSVRCGDGCSDWCVGSVR